MHSLVHHLATLLEALFILGWVGSIFVVVISGLEDLKTIFSKDGTEHHAPIEG